MCNMVYTGRRYKDILLFTLGSHFGVTILLSRNHSIYADLFLQVNLDNPVFRNERKITQF